MPEVNPIADRMNILHQQWLAFTRSKVARLLVWRVTPDEAVFVDSFVARECNADTAQTPDLFVQLSSPFQTATQHGFTLSAELAASYELALPAADAAQQRTRWFAPPVQAASSDIELLLATLASFRDHHAAPGADLCLAVSLCPGDVAALSSHAHWLQRLVHAAPPALRFVLLEHVGSHTLLPLAQAEPERVMVVSAALDLPGALEAAARGQLEEHPAPGAQLRLLHTQLRTAIADNDLTRAVPLAQAATELASCHSWPHLAAGAQLMLAAGYGKSERHADALAAYTRAEQHALLPPAATVESGHSAPASSGQSEIGTRLRLTALLGRGATWIALRRYTSAADCYLTATALAHSLHDPRSELDGYRLAALCYALASLPHKAWAMGQHGLRFALSMDDETRRTSTAPYLAQQLLQLTTTESSYRPYRRSLEQQLRMLLGEHWRAQVAQTTSVVSAAPVVATQ